MLLRIIRFFAFCHNQSISVTTPIDLYIQKYIEVYVELANFMYLNMKHMKTHRISSGWIHTDMEWVMRYGQPDVPSFDHNKDYQPTGGFIHRWS